MTNAKHVLEALERLAEDEDIPRGVASKITALIADFRNTSELSLTVNKAVGELEEMAEDVNLPQFVRTQIWAVMGQLAALESELVKAQ